MRHPFICKTKLPKQHMGHTNPVIQSNYYNSVSKSSTTRKMLNVTRSSDRSERAHFLSQLAHGLSIALEASQHFWPCYGFQTKLNPISKNHSKVIFSLKVGRPKQQAGHRYAVDQSNYLNLVSCSISTMLHGSRAMN